MRRRPIRAWFRVGAAALVIAAIAFQLAWLANEGRFVLFLPEAHVEHALRIIGSQTSGKSASLIGHVGKGGSGVKLKSRIGASRIVDMFSGEQLPRIC